MEILHAIVLGITQGLSEFLPISSSGHLRLVPWLFGWDDFAGQEHLQKTFDVALHFGTLAGALAYFRADVVRYARAQGVERFGALVPVGNYGQRASGAMLRAVRESGGKVTAVETYERSRAKLQAAVRRLTDYEARVARASQGGIVRADGTVAPVQERLGPVSFQALLIADGSQIASAFLGPLAQYGAGPGKVRYLGPELWNAEPGIRSVQGLHGAWYASVPDARFDQLAARYRTKFGGAPSRLASLGYDSVLLVNAIADSWTIGSSFPEARLRDSDGFAGVDGIFRFGASGIADRGLEVGQVGASGTTVVSPAPRTFAKRPGA